MAQQLPWQINTVMFQFRHNNHHFHSLAWLHLLHVVVQVSGTPERPRLAVYRSNQHIYAQVRAVGRLAAQGRCWGSSTSSSEAMARPDFLAQVKAAADQQQWRTQTAPSNFSQGLFSLAAMAAQHLG